MYSGRRVDTWDIGHIYGIGLFLKNVACTLGTNYGIGVIHGIYRAHTWDRAHIWDSVQGCGFTMQAN